MWISENSKLIQFAVWAFTALGGAFAWYGEHAKVQALGSYITVEDLNDNLHKNHQHDSITSVYLLEDFKVNLHQQGAIYVQKYWEPLAQSNEELRMGLENQKDLTRQLIIAQGSMNATLRDKLLRESKQDSLAAENAKLKAQIKTQATVTSIVQDLKEDLKPKKRELRDKVE